MNLKIIPKNHAADQEKKLFTMIATKKSISKPYGRATAKPTAWETCLFPTFFNEIIKKHS